MAGPLLELRWGASLSIHRGNRGHRGRTHKCSKYVIEVPSRMKGEHQTAIAGFV